MPNFDTAPGEAVALELREASPPMLRGHAAVFNTLSQNLGGFREQIAPGAFAEALSSDVRLLVNHEGMPYARTNGTMTLKEDTRGLYVEAELDGDDPDTRTLIRRIQRGLLSQMSFGFTPNPGGQDWGEDENGVPIRTLKSVRLFDVSVVAFPAYTATDVTIRSLREFEARKSVLHRPNMLAALSRVPAVLA